jgi:putative spermidine/putrescine transport system substrate-binding protein
MGDTMSRTSFGETISRLSSRRLSRRTFVSGAASMGTLALTSGTTRAQAGGPIVVTTFGGFVEKTFRSALAEPFEKETGIKVILKLGSMSEWLTSAMVNRRKPDIDVLWLAFPESIRAVMEDDVVMELSKERIPNLADVRPIWLDMFDRKGVGHEYAAFGIGYRADMLQDPPKSWADFWSPKYAGQIALPDINSNGSWEFLMMAARLNGGDESKLDIGLDAVKRLKPGVKRFFKSLTEAQNLLDTGEAGMVGPITDLRVYALQDQGKPVKFVLPSEGTIPSLVSFHIAKNTANREQSEKFVNFALSKPGLTDFCNALICGVPRADVQLNDKARSRVAPFETLVIFDWRKIVPSMKRYTEVWNREVIR